jgi:hypothetical protein
MLHMLLAMSAIVEEEEDMPAPQWRLRRQPSPRPDGQQRWDRAYLHLLHWTQPPLAPQPPVQPLPRQEKEEDSHDARPVCARLDPAPGPHANH